MTEESRQSARRTTSRSVSVAPHMIPEYIDMLAMIELQKDRSNRLTARSATTCWKPWSAANTMAKNLR